MTFDKKNVILEFKNWKGKNLNYFKNFCLGGPSGMKPFLMTCGFMSIPYSIHIYQTSVWFTKEVSVAIPIIGGCLLLLIFILMSIATFIDAGIIPRNIIKNSHVAFNREVIKKKKNIVHLGVIKKISKCESCLIIKPFRSSHCPDCDNCVLRFDHHCPWIGNCVGYRNYKYFFSFLIVMNIFCFYLVVVSLYHVVMINKIDINLFEFRLDKSNPEKSSLKLTHTAASIFVIIYCLLAILFITGLLGYHCYLVSSNQTTKEELKNAFKKYPQGNPYLNGCLNSWSDLFCRNRLPNKSTFEIVKQNSI